jgi:hypothetical protein
METYLDSLECGLSAENHVPNEETGRVIEDAFAGRNLHSAQGVDDLFSQLES